MSNSIVLRNNPRITVTANSAGLLMATDGAWTVSMRADEAMEYIANVEAGDNPSRGFYKFPPGWGAGDAGKYVLSHNGAKITLSQEETSKLVEFIRESSRLWPRSS